MFPILTAALAAFGAAANSSSMTGRAGPAANDRPGRPSNNAPIDDYFRTVQDTKWVYKYSDPRTTDSATSFISKVVDNDGQKIVTVSYIGSSGKASESYTVTVSAKGVFRTKTYGSKDVPELQGLLLYPVKIDDQWEYEADFVSKGRRLIWKCQLTKRETVQVPAGKYEAVRVELTPQFDDKPPKATRQSNATAKKRTEWYASGVGLVKHEHGGTTLELAEFTPGKK